MARTQQYSNAEKEKLTLISNVELFSTLLDDDLAYVASRTGFRSVQKDTVIFSAGDTASQFFIVKSGSVSITSTVTGSRPLVLARYVSGDVFGDFHFVINAPYNATALALEKTELLVFPQDGMTFDRLSDEKPDTTSRMLLRSISMISSRLRSTNQLISENTPWIRELRNQIYTDPPTGLWNKAYMDAELPPLLSGSVAVIMIKPDNFKELNDLHGHAAGDLVIVNIAAMLIARSQKAPHGWAIRLRSNETCLILSDTDRAEAKQVTSEIANMFPALIPPNLTRKDFTLTASIAVGMWPDDGKNWHLITEQANNLMQTVWKSGGNKTAWIGNETI